MSDNYISLIIPTLNRCDSLRLTLQSALAQDLSSDAYEILVVDNGSSDGTRGCVDAFMEAHPEATIRYVLESEPGLLAGRHRGAAEAHGGILTYIDDDVDLAPSFLRAIRDAFNRLDVRIVAGKSTPRYEADPPVWVDDFWVETPYGKQCPYLSLSDLGDNETEIDPSFTFGLNYSIRRDALYALGGFNPDLYPDYLAELQGDGEVGLSRKARRAGYIAIYVPRATVYHRISANRLTLPYFTKRAFTEGIFNSYAELRRDADARRAGRATMLEMALRGFRRRQQLVVAAIETSILSAVIFVIDGIGGPERLAARWRVRRAYRRGYGFHRRAAFRSPTIREWVARDNYLSYSVPKL